MKKYLFLFMLIWTCIPVFAVSPIFRAVIVGDTNTLNTKEHLKSDVLRMQKTLEVIAKKIGCQLDMCTLVDNQFTSDDIQTWLEKLPKASNDIVFFYYTGHGCKVQGNCMKNHLTPNTLRRYSGLHPASFLLFGIPNFSDVSFLSKLRAIFFTNEKFSAA